MQVISFIPLQCHYFFSTVQEHVDPYHAPCHRAFETTHEQPFPLAVPISHFPCSGSITTWDSKVFRTSSSPRAPFTSVPDVRTDRYDHLRVLPTTFEEPSQLSDVLHRYYVTTTPTSWCRIMLEKLKVSQPVKKFVSLYGTRRFITAFTTAYHLSLS